MRRPRGGAACRSLPTAARASPLRVGGGSRWAPPGVRQVGGRVRAAGPPWGEPWGKGGAVSGRDARSASASPAPRPLVRGSPSRPPSPPEPQPVAACGHGPGRLARERRPRVVAPRGSDSDGRRICGGWMAEDGWTARRPWRRGRVAGHAPGMAGAGRRPGRRGTALACGWRWDPALVFLGARPRGPVFFLRSPDGARVPVPRPPPCVLAGPSPPPPASPRLSSSRACDRPRSRPLPGPEPASPRLHVGVVPRPLPGRWRPRAERCSALGKP